MALEELHQDIREMCRRFADEELAPHAAQWDEAHTFPREALRKLGSLGLMGVAVPEQWGGAGLDPVAYAVAVEELSRGCASVGVIVSVNNSLYCSSVLHFGNDAQRTKWLTPFARGEKLGCFALTEPQSGSDAQRMMLRARRVPGGYRLDGSKCFITNGPHADAAVVFASVEGLAAHRGNTAFIVPTDSAGLARGANDKKLGIRAAHSCPMYFEDCVVPEENRLGEEGGGFKIAMAALDGGRIGIAAQALGIARAAFEAALKYSGERKSFGKAIREHQAVQFMLADMATELEAARALVLKAAAREAEGGRYTLEAAQAKLYASEMSERVTSAAIQVFGGYGYIADFPVERHYRDARITQLYEGTSEIQRLVIANQLLA